MVDKSIFKIGDIIVDTLTQEIGLLVERYDVFEDYWDEIDDYGDDDMGPIWAWQILWSGSKTPTTKTNRYSAYTEVGLVSLVNEGEFELIQEDPKILK